MSSWDGFLTAYQATCTERVLKKRQEAVWKRLVSSEHNKFCSCGDYRFHFVGGLPTAPEKKPHITPVAQKLEVKYFASPEKKVSTQVEPWLIPGDFDLVMEDDEEEAMLDALIEEGAKDTSDVIFVQETPSRGREGITIAGWPRRLFPPTGKE